MKKYAMALSLLFCIAGMAFGVAVDNNQPAKDREGRHHERGDYKETLWMFTNQQEAEAGTPQVVIVPVIEEGK